MINKNFIIITGLSGAGKSTVSNTLEDLGFYTVDNLPIMLIPKFVEVTFGYKSKLDKVALTVDIRSMTLEDIFEVIKNIKYKYNLFILFLEASEETLIKRFKETRRKHPLGDNITSVINLERDLLLDLKSISDLIIDTTDMNVHELSSKIETLFSNVFNKKINIIVQSFGFKYGIPQDSDIVLDVRFLTNPYFVENLKDLNGESEEVQQCVLSDINTKVFLNKLYELMDFLIPLYIKEGKKYLTLSLGCTGGKHRSVVLVKLLYEYLFKHNIGNIIIKHRDINR
jgi:UPF0042 nucleotide-binding protein